MQVVYNKLFLQLLFFGKVIAGVVARLLFGGGNQDPGVNS